MKWTTTHTLVTILAVLLLAAGGIVVWQVAKKKRTQTNSADDEATGNAPGTGSGSGDAGSGSQGSGGNGQDSGTPSPLVNPTPFVDYQGTGSMTSAQAEEYADQLALYFNAWGTRWYYWEKIQKVIAGKSIAQLQAIVDKFQQKYQRSFLQELEDELQASQQQWVLNKMKGVKF